MMLTSVDLPAPFLPMMPWTSPRRTSMLALRSAIVPGKNLETSLSTSAGVLLA